MSDRQSLSPPPHENDVVHVETPERLEPTEDGDELTNTNDNTDHVGTNANSNRLEPRANIDVRNMIPYIQEADRLDSFANWPHVHPSPALMAAAGFYADDDTAATSSSSCSATTGTIDAVRCPVCQAAFSGFDGERDVWAILSHAQGCILAKAIGQARNRSCIECHQVFLTIGSKLNHCKRIHPLPEEERRKKAEKRAQIKRLVSSRRVRKVYAASPAAAASGGEAESALQRRRRSYSLAQGSASSGWNSVNTGRRGSRLVPIDRRSSVYGRGASRALSDDGGEAGMGEPIAMDADLDIAALGGLSFTGVRTMTDCEPNVHNGEIVMSRAEYREFRQHFRAMTYIFRDVDCKQRY